MTFGTALNEVGVPAAWIRINILLDLYHSLARIAPLFLFESRLSALQLSPLNRDIYI